MATPLIDQAAINNVLAQGLEATADTLFDAYIEAIESPVYKWPNTTIRESGEIAGTIRNIVDLGNFRNSQQYELIDPLLAEFTWGGGRVHYAPQVFFGFTTAAGNTYPGRNPVIEAHKSINPTEVFAANLRRLAA